MAAELNHTIVWCHDKQHSSAWLAEMLGRPVPRSFFHFMVVDFDNNVSLDFMEKTGDIALQHYAFLVGDEDFDAVFARLQAAGQTWWADPVRTRPGEINRHFGGRGVYFEDPNGHLLEVMTTSYGGEDEVA